MKKCDTKKTTPYQAPKIQSSRAEKLQNRTVEVNACFSFFQGQNETSNESEQPVEDGVTY